VFTDCEVTASLRGDAKPTKAGFRSVFGASSCLTGALCDVGTIDGTDSRVAEPVGSNVSCNG
jgi:hypothetical protein